MQILKGKIYYKQTEQWCGNDSKGAAVKVIDFVPPFGFVKYRKAIKVFGINFFIGRSYYINQISFKRIYLGKEFIR